MDIALETTVADVAAGHPGTIRVFQRHGVDFCCGGKRPLSEVCEEKGLAFEVLRADLHLAMAAPAPDAHDWTTAPLTELVAHIVPRYHDTLREELPRLAAMAEKVARVHGERHPEVIQVDRTHRALVADLMPHMMKEERILFPYLAGMDEIVRLGRAFGGSPFGTVKNPIQMMEVEHEAVGQLLADLRGITSSYTAPEDACNTYRGLYHGLVELERELMEHIHLENNVLFPRSVRLEEELESRPRTRS